MIRRTTRRTGFPFPIGCFHFRHYYPLHLVTVDTSFQYLYELLHWVLFFPIVFSFLHLHSILSGLLILSEILAMYESSSSFLSSGHNSFQRDTMLTTFLQICFIPVQITF
uniref:Uncharacterized protein n=1 Tax=Arundo donax TaxID=35708 RepID=A0A0A9B1Y7_ARUDO